MQQRDRNWGEGGPPAPPPGPALLYPNMGTLGLLWVGQGSLGRSEDIGLQGEQGGEGPELGGKGERCLLLDQRFLSPMPETMGPARRLLVQGVGLGLPVPNGQGLVVP